MLFLYPLPSFKVFFKSLFLYKSKNKLEPIRWKNPDEKISYLSRSSWSIALIAYLRLKLFDVKKIIIWIPDYFCNESLTQLRSLGGNILFYPVNDQMNPELSSFESLIKKGRPDIFILVHYFGKPSQSESVKDFCKNNGTWLIEDSTHVLFPSRGIGSIGDFVLYSPHKHLPIPNGAFLVYRKNGPSSFTDEQLVSLSKSENLYSLVNCIKGSGLKTQSYLSFTIDLILWILKRFSSKLGFHKINFKKDKFYHDQKSTDIKLAWPFISKLSMKMLSYLVLDLDLIAQVKRENQLLFEIILKKKSSIKDKIKFNENSEVGIGNPYLSSYVIQDGYQEYVYDEMIKAKLPVCKWPDLPPEVLSNKEFHRSAFYLRYSIIFLSINQTLRLDKYIRSFEKISSSNKKSFNIVCEWNNVNRTKWNEYFKNPVNSNLLQTWDYGDAKRDVEGWIVNRGVFYLNKNPIAILQVLEKRFLFFKILRVNRGPILLKKINDFENQKLLDLISDMGNLFRFQILFFAPNYFKSGTLIYTLLKLGFWKTPKLNWQSALVDLSFELSDLRKMLDAKWRNMLNFSERSGLQIEYGSDIYLFEWMLENYENLMNEKKFIGPSVDFLRDLYNKNQLTPFCKYNSFFTLRAVKDNSPLAGICILIHGDTATYLLGYNSDLGRGLKANQFIIWQAVKFLKDQNIRWFDLGGIDKINNPGVAQFKIGINGNNYENVGEFIKC